MMTQPVVPFRGGVFTVETECRSGERVEHQGDNPSGVRLESDSRHLKHQLDFLEELLFVRNLCRLPEACTRLWSQLPLARSGQPVLNLSDRVQILIEFRSVRMGHFPVQVTNFLSERIEDASFLFQPLDLTLHCLRVALEEHFFEESWSAVFRRKKDAIACPRKAAVRFVDVHPKVQRGETGGLPQFFDDELIEGNLVPESTLGGASSACEKTVLGAVPA